jgi:ADP-dependent NAD(P)H-hydrate dehydratase
MPSTELQVEGPIDAAYLRGWPLPAPGDSKRSRGNVLVIGGARRSPGAAQLAGVAALRVGAGRLTFAVGESSAAGIAVAVPESGVIPLAETESGHVRGRSLQAARDDVHSADAVLVGSGLDDIAETRKLLGRLRDYTDPHTTVVLDAYALGAIAGRARLARTKRLILTPNPTEAALLVGRNAVSHEGESLERDLLTIARRYRAVVSCQGLVADPEGRLVLVAQGGPGLGTSGSGDALAGAITGLAARGCEPLQAAVWGTYLHAAAGDSLARDIAPLGFLASEIVARLPFELETIEHPAP